MIDLDPKFPILFFPIRIETKYSSNDETKRTLRLRFFPDQVTINNFDPRLTLKEFNDAKRYWTATNRNSAWTKLANRYGLPRSAYITKAVINYDPNSDPDPTNPSFKADNAVEIRKEDDIAAPLCKMLPSRFIFHGKFNDPTLGTKEKVGMDIPESLSFDSFLIDNTTDPPSPNWVTDFELASKKGMALEVDLSEEEYKSGFEYIIVYGVREDLASDKTKQEIEDLFRAQRYSVGLSFVKQGTPTNLIREKSKDADVKSFFSPHSLTESDITNYRSVEFAPLEKERSDMPSMLKDLAVDGRIFEKALGLDNVANGLLYADNDDQITAGCMSNALLPSVLGYFMKTFVNIPVNNPELFKFILLVHFVRYVSAQGPIPPIRVGRTPYGILPVTIISNQLDSRLATGTNHVGELFGQLKTRWTKFIDEVPTVMKKGEGIDPTDTLLDILSMEAYSPSYNVRGFRSVSYISDFIFEILGIKTPTGMPTGTDSELKAKNMISLNILLHIIFPKIPNKALDGFYELCPGEGLSGINFPLVNNPEDADSLNPNYIDKILNDKAFFKPTKDQRGFPDVAPSNSDPLLLRLLRYSSSIIGQKNDLVEISEFRQNLKFLSTKSAERLKTLMLQTLDLVSYRLDAWISSFANERLDAVRRDNGKGLYAGAFGWVEKLKPKGPQNQTQLENQIPEGGYIQTPSYGHAAAAAVLRNAYLTHFSDKEKKDLLKINLSSERTKNALEIINNIQYTPLSELLGYRLERRLHDAEIDYLIDEFRRHFPLNKDDRKELVDAQQPGQERIEPRNVTDGLSVFKNWKRLTDDDQVGYSDVEKIKKGMEHDPGWESFYSEIRTKYGPDDQKMIELIKALKPQLNNLLDQMDGLSDLCVSESVFQAVGGNYLRSGAVLDGMSGDGQIPIPEISIIPRSGPRQVQRIALALEVEPVGTLSLPDVLDDVSWTSPRRLAEPNLNNLLTSYIGGTSFWLDLRDESGNVTSTEKLGLTELGLEAIDLLYIENSEIESRLNYYAKSKGIDNYDIRFDDKKSSSEEIEITSFSDVQFLIKNARALTAQGHSLRYSDFISPNKAIEGGMLLDSIKELFQRYYDIVLLLIHTIKQLQLELASNDVTEIGIENKRQAIIKAGFFANEFAVPINAEGNIMEVDELNKKIDAAKEVLKSRLPPIVDQEKKLSEWRSKLAGGEKAFLESITNELSGEPEDASKYLKTIDILVVLIKKILNNNSFLILPPFDIPTVNLKKLKSSARTNREVLKWIGKASYVRPQLRYLDEVITHNQILDSANFSFYRDMTKFDKAKFMKSLEIPGSGNEDINLTSIILAISTKTGEQEKSFPSEPSKPNAVLVGIVVDEWTDKIVSKDQETYIAYNYDGPSTEAPQSLLLGVSPNQLQRWNEDTIRQVIVEALELVKIRAVSYKYLKGIQNFLPTLLLNAYGEEVNIDLLGGDFTG